MNDSFMMKVAWELCTKPIIDLWVRVVHSKYGCGEEVMPIIDKTRRGSNLWSSIKIVWDDFHANCEVLGTSVRWRVSSDSNF